MTLRPRKRRTPSAGKQPAMSVVTLLCAIAAAGCADGGAAVNDPPTAGPSEPSVDPALLRARLLTDSTAVIGRDTVLLHAATVPFYRERGFEAAWSDRRARASVSSALASVEDEGIRPADVRADRLAAVLEAGVTDNSTRVDRDLLLTDGFFRLADALLGRRFDIRTVYRFDWHPTLRSADVSGILRAALADTAAGPAIARALAALRPADPEYGYLRGAMTRARLDDGTPSIDPDVRLSPGDASEVVLTLRRRLAATGDWTGRQRPDTLALVFDEPLADALRRFQARAGLQPTAELDGATVKALNTPGRRLVPLLAVNLERWRWLPADLGARHIWVNIPAFELEVRGRDAGAWVTRRSMPVVVGSGGRWRTPVFSDTISQVVFNPTWRIPASIQRESYGRVDPRGMVRRPGPSNPLGRVKFVFPNPYGIYLHDTNAPWRLAWDYRALSHGCVRLGDPRGLARDLLGPQGWDSTRVAAHFTGPWVTEPIDLTHPMPVHLVYFTARASADGSVRRTIDVYGWDQPLADALGYTDEDLTAAREAIPVGRPPG